MTGVIDFALRRPDYDMLRLQARLGYGFAVVALACQIMAFLYGGFWLTVAFATLGAVYLAAAVIASRRADSILQRCLAARLIEDGPGVMAEAA